MKKMKLFLKTFLYTLLMLLVINLSMHLMIYFFYPKVYLNRVQKNLDDRLNLLQENMKDCSEDEIGNILSDFARQNSVNVTVDTDGGQKTYQGMNFHISLFSDKDEIFSVSDFEDAQSIIVKKRTMEKQDGTNLQLQVMASSKPLKEATEIIIFLLPFTFGTTILFSVVFAYFYSKKITNPILNMLKVTSEMKHLKPDAAFHVQTEDEMGILAEQINEVYECLLQTILRLDEEKQHMLAMEKTKLVFLRSASHELKTPLAGLRILLENMQYGIGKYKNRDIYLAKAVDIVDELTGMVKDILDTSKIQDQFDSSEKKELSVSREINSVLSDYKIQISDKNLQLEVDIPEQAAIVMNEESFRRVWSNLINNAVRYTEAGGSIAIRADEKKIWIENTCRPLKPEQLQYIFEPFYRPDDTRNMVGGNGLGLYMISEILKKEGFSYVFEPFEDGMRFVHSAGETDQAVVK